MLGWFERLVFTLTRCLKDEEKKNFQGIGINILSVLEEEHFAPNWKLLDEPTRFKDAYHSCLVQIAKDWGINTFPRFDGGVGGK